MTKVPLPIRLLLGLLILGSLIVLLIQGQPHPGWAALALAGSVLAGTWIGWGIRQIWIYPPLLRGAQALWTQRGPASEVAERLERANLATGELGRQVFLLLGKAHFALGYTNQAWLDFLRADLARLPLWLRWPVRMAFQSATANPTPRQIAHVTRLVRLAPFSGRLHHLLGILLLRTGSIPEAWSQFEAALPLACEDPLVLEDLLLASLRNGREDLAEEALNLLRDHHGDARLPWDRGAAGLFLLQKGRPAEALTLVRGLPPSPRPSQTQWLTKTLALRQLGATEEAWQSVQEAVADHPDSFRLWMERHRLALDLSQEADALQSLDRAWDALPSGPDGPALAQEWHLRRAEFAFWWQDQPETALEHLEQVSPTERGDHHPPLELQIRLALGENERVYREVTSLLQTHPEDPDLRLLQADCLAGMGAWKALLPLLEGMGEACRQQALFWHLRGLAHANLGHPHEAWLDLDRAVRLDPQNLRLLLDAGHGCAEVGNWTQAEALWRQALRMAPQNEEALLSLAEARREGHDPESARRYLRECLLHHPESLAAQTALAELEAN